MKIKTPTDTKFKNYHSQLLKHLRLKGLQPKTVDAYERAIKRIYNYFKGHAENLSSDQMLDYFNQLLASHSYCKYVGKGDKAIIYLGKYLYRGVLAEKSIKPKQLRENTFIIRLCNTFYPNTLGVPETMALPIRTVKKPLPYCTMF